MIRFLPNRRRQVLNRLGQSLVKLQEARKKEHLLPIFAKQVCDLEPSTFKLPLVWGGRSYQENREIKPDALDKPQVYFSVGNYYSITPLVVYYSCSNEMKLIFAYATVKQICIVNLLICYNAKSFRYSLYKQSFNYQSVYIFYLKPPLLLASVHLQVTFFLKAS